MKRIVPLLGVLAFLVLGCSDEENSVGGAAPEILSFTSSVRAIDSGDTATLSWRTQAATTVEIVDGAGTAVDLGAAAAAEGSVEVRPAETTTFRLVARGGGKSASAEIVITVREAPGDAPAIDAFSASPAVIAAGDEVELAWSVRFADAVEIHDAMGTPVELGDAAAASGSVTIAVEASTTFELTARGPGGEATATVEVVVQGAPVGTFAGPANPVEPGEAAALTWSTENASNVRITDAAGTAVLYDGSDASGSIEVQPLITAEYVLVATGAAGELNLRTSVRVTPVIDRFEILTEDPIRSGDDVDVAWDVRGASQLVIQRQGETLPVPEGAIESGTAVVRIPATGSLTLVATSGDLEVTAVASVTLSLAPRIYSVTFDPPIVTASPEMPAEVELSWHAGGATQLTVESLTDGPIDTTGKSPFIDSVTTQVTTTTIFRVTATNEHGSHTVDAEMPVLGAPRLVRFDVLPAVAMPGEILTVTWETTDATQVVIEKDGIALPTTELSGTFTDTMGAVSASFVLRAQNDTAFELQSDPVVVTQGEPEILTFSAASPSAAPGTTLDLAWTNSGGQLVRVEEGGIDVCTITDLAQIQAGGCSVTVPTVQGDYTYTLHLTNGLGTAATPRTVEVAVTDGPIIESFAAEFGIATTGSPVRLDWTTRPDAAGTAPTLILGDDLGNPVDVTVFPGTYMAVVGQPGIRTYTLTASTPGTQPDSRNLTIDVRGVPTVSLVATPDSLTTDGNPNPTSMLTWTAQHGVELAIYQLDGQAQPIVPALLETTDAATVASGSLQVSPPYGITPYMVVVDNGAGATAISTVTVSVDIASATITADKTDIFQGEDVTFTWSAARSHNWTISRPLPGIVVGSEPIIDVPNSPTAQQLVLSSSTTLGYVDVSFPTGFLFPWDGDHENAARVSMNGWIAFDASGTDAATATNPFLPSSTYSYVALAPFWDALDLESNATNVTGKVFMDSGFGAGGNYVVFHWSEFGTSSSTAAAPASLNFQVILWEDGTFDYRYGTMRSYGTNSSTLSQQRADGLSATIGYQTSGSNGYTWSYNSDVPGGLSNKSLNFDPRPLPASGSRTIRVFTGTSSAAASLTWELFAENWASSDTDTVTVSSDGQLKVNYAYADADEPEANENFTFGWSAVNCTLIEVLDAFGAVLYSDTGTGSSTAKTGTFSWMEPIEGNYPYSIRFTGKRTWDVRSIDAPVYVYAPLSIDSFTANVDVVDPGQPVTLAWALTGAASVELLADGSPVDISTVPLTGGSIALTPASTTRYVLNVYDNTGTGRTRTADVQVGVRLSQLTSLTASPLLLPPGGGTVTLTWTSTGGTRTSIEGHPNVTPVTGGFVDISLMPGVEPIPFAATTSAQEAPITFPAGFSFPFSGQEMTSAVVSSAGVLSFMPDAQVSATNGPLPDTADDEVHLAPFWDTLYPGSASGGAAYYLAGNDGTSDYLIVQWTNFVFSSSSAVDNVSFQVVLYENGDFGFHYGSMVSSSSGRADGDSATIGYQTLSNQNGMTLSNNTAVAGGLSNTGWLFGMSEAANGSATRTVDRTTTFTVCAQATGWSDCQDVAVIVLEPGIIQISEVMANPAAGLGPAGEWFELYNASPGVIDLEGWVITSGAESHTISTGAPFLLQPRGVVALARSGDATNGGFTPGYVYGNDITLDPLGDALSIEYAGGPVDTVTWDGTWFGTPGQTLAVNTIRIGDDGSINDLLANWCSSSVAFGTGSGQAGSPGWLDPTDSCLPSSPYYVAQMTDASDFIDIETTGTTMPVTGTSSSGYDTYGNWTGGIGFDFPYFGDLLPSTTTVGMTQHGFIAFEALSAHNKVNSTMPDPTGPNGIIAVFWDETAGNSGYSMKTELLTVGTDQVRIFQWSNYRRYAVSNSHVVMQVQLWSNGDIATIIKNLDPPPGGTTSATAAMQMRGGSATRGIESLTGLEGILISFDEEIVTTNSGVFYERITTTP